jgi:anti-sigma regulatory factor (Ser/Thr protein kinase)
MTGAMAAHRQQAPRFTQVPPRIPRDPKAQDHGWPDRWPFWTQLELAALDTAPGCARAHARAVLWEWKADDAAADDVLIVVSELVTNAVAAIQKHRRPNPVRLWMLGDGASILFLVWDATMPAPVRDSATPDAEYGRGLAIVEALCVRWGAYYPDEHPGGKVVWTLMRTAACPTTPLGPDRPEGHRPAVPSHKVSGIGASDRQ